jgi:hypothetical protein
MSRCPQLSRHLTFAQGSEFNLRTPSYTVSLATLRRALKYLYSGSSDVLAPVSSSADAAADSGDLSSITLLQQEFGTPNSLESDIVYLWESGSMADCRLTFNFCDKTSSELMCHRTILAARSGFFRRLIDRRVKANPLLSSSGQVLAQKS